MVRIRAQALNKPTGEELGPLMQRTAVDLSALLSRVSLPATWKLEQLKPEVLDRLDPRTYPESSYEHFNGRVLRRLFDHGSCHGAVQ